MSGSTGQPVTTSTQTSVPNVPNLPFLQQMWGAAAGLQGRDAVAPMVPELWSPGEGLQNIQNIANIQASNQEGTYYRQLQVAKNVLAEMINQRGITPTVQSGLDTLQKAGGQFENLYQTNIGTENPWLEQAIAGNQRQTADRIASGMSGAGRYGSGQYTDVMSRAMQEVADPVYAQDYMQRQQLAQQATQGLGQVGQTTAGIGATANQQMMGGMGMLTQLGQAEYLPAQMQFAVGQYLQDRAQAQYDTPWTNLAREAQVIGAPAALGGTVSTAQTPMQQPLMTRLLGGGLAGAGIGGSIGGPMGAGIGALGGAAMGGFL